MLCIINADLKLFLQDIVVVIISPQHLKPHDQKLPFIFIRRYANIFSMHLLTRTFDNIPHMSHGTIVYAISTTKPQRYKDIPILYLFAPTFDAQIEYNMTKDFDRFNERMAAIFKQRTSAIEDWVKANSEAKVCLACWEGIDSCHRRLAVEAVKQAGERLGIPITVDIG